MQQHAAATLRSTRMNFLSDFALHQVKWINFEVDQTHSPWGVQLPYRDSLLCMPIIWQPLPETASTNTVRFELCDSRYSEATGADRLSHKPWHLHQPQSPWVSDHTGGGPSKLSINSDDRLWFWWSSHTRWRNLSRLVLDFTDWKSAGNRGLDFLNMF